MKVVFPDLSFETRWRSNGKKIIAGLDEAGRGPLAGPVVAAAAILPEGFKNFGIADSKLLSAPARERIFELIINSDIIYSIGIINHLWIDKVNIYRASQLAMMKAVERLPFRPDLLLIDGMNIKDLAIEQEKVIKGDRKVLSIAAASILAKVTRDRIMERFDRIYEGYGLARHKGYPTAAHVAALKEKGITAIHRKTFGPVREIIEKSGDNRPVARNGSIKIPLDLSNRERS
jgi:ribonuclease HII